MAVLLAPPTKNAIQKTLAAQLLSTASTGDPITFDDVDGIPNLPGVLVIRRIDTSGVATPSYREYIEYSGTSGTTVLITTRNVDGSNSALTHPVGSIVEFIPDVVWADRIYDALGNLIDPSDLSIDTTKVPVAPGDSGNVLTSDGTNWTSAAPSGGTAFWGDVPGTPTRVSDTQFTITDTSNANSYDLLFKKGVILKWLESTTFQTAMVISSSYGTNTVTINIVGDSLTAGFSAMQYGIPEAKQIEFIIPGTMPSAATTNISRTYILPEPMYLLSYDLNLATAGSGAGSFVVDLNLSGSTIATTKATITSTGTSDLDNVLDNPSTERAAAAALTVDVDSITAVAGSDAYITVYGYPSSWRYR